MIAGEGDALPVSALPADGTYPTGTARWEKRDIALEIPAWDEALCIQCGKCVLVCPHAVIRAKVYAPAMLAGAPAAFKSAPGPLARVRRRPVHAAGRRRRTAPAVRLCVEVCPAKSKSEVRHKAIDMVPQAPLRDAGGGELGVLPRRCPRRTGTRCNMSQVKDVQLLQPLFEFSGACAGCGETPYLKLLSQLFGDRALIANATGCSSIYGGNLPTTPWTVNRRRPRTRLGQLPVRGQRGVRPRHAPRPGQAGRVRPRARRPARRRDRRARRRAARRRPIHAKPASRPSGSGLAELKRGARRAPRAGGAASS